MEIIEYEEPTSWDDKGMNWEDPDPRSADYVMAIRQALMERCAALHIGLRSEVLAISPWKAVSIDQIREIILTIRTIADMFFNKGFNDYKEDYSDFPRMWTYRELIQEEGCGLYELPKYGDFCENGGEILKRIKTAIDKLTVIRCPGASGIRHSRSGARHDPPFSESIGDAMERAMDEKEGYTKSKFNSLPMSIYAWSGNTHWKCPRPKDEGDSDEGEEEDENDKDGYCGYAESVSYTFERIRNWLSGCKIGFLIYTFLSEPKDPVPFSQELATSIFDGGESNFKKGMTSMTVTVGDPMDVDFNLGDHNSIPKNGTVPVSDFDDDGNATHRRSAKRGYAGKVWFFSDYGVQGGFKFKSAEV